MYHGLKIYKIYFPTISSTRLKSGVSSSQMWVSSQKCQGNYDIAIPHQVLPIIAASCENGLISAYNDEGDKIDPLCFKRDVNPIKLAWHPLKKFLAAAYSNGKFI